jgi:hypothetical protein
VSHILHSFLSQSSIRYAPLLFWPYKYIAAKLRTFSTTFAAC